MRAAITRLAAIVGAASGSLLLASAAQAQDEGYLTYRMASGDTLIGLDARYMTGGDAVERVARINRIRNPRRIPIGKELLLPRDLLAWEPVQLVVRAFSGPVTIDGATPQPGAILREGSVIRSGRNGFISFQTNDGAAIAMPSNSHARLVRSRVYALRNTRDIHFRILGGRGEVQAPSLREGERLRTGTPVAVTAVRGTTFRVAYDEATGLGVSEVVEGLVSIANDDFERIANAGFGVAATEQGISEEERLLPPAEIIEPGAIQTGESVTFAIDPSMGAQAARTQVARDAGFLEIIAEDIGADGEAQFAGIADGRYFVRARAIAESGIEGLSETYSFRRKRLGAEALVEPSPLADGFRFAWLAQGEGTTHFAFQLWREGEVDALLFDEIALPGSATVITALDPGVYVWRVAALQADAEDGLLKVWGPEQRLTVSE